MTEHAIQSATISEPLPRKNKSEKALQLDPSEKDEIFADGAFEAHIRKMYIANSTGALKLNFQRVVMDNKRM